MPIPLGTWQANVGGTRQALVIRSVETTGRVTGEITTAPFPVPLLGVWDEDAQKLTFVLIRPIDGGRFVSGGFGTGYMFIDSVNLTGVSGSSIFTLAGRLEIFPSLGFGPALSARRSEFGWYAQLGLQ